MTFRLDKSSLLATVSIAGLMLTQMPALSETVTLRANDSDTFMTGDLLDHDDTHFVLKTQFGQVRIDRSSVTCEGPACPVAPTVQADMVITGSDTVGEELMPLLIEAYAERLGAGVSDRIEGDDDIVGIDVRDDAGEGEELFLASVQSKGSSTGLSDLIEGRNMVAMASRPARGSEVRAVQGQGRGNLNDISQDYIVAVDSILVAVAPGNPVSELTVGQLADVFSGRVSNWSEVGGPDLAINVYTRDTESGTFGVFNSAILRPTRQEISPDATPVASNTEMADKVTEDPGGIGYVGFASIRNAKPLDIVASCGIRMKATPFAAKTEEYLLQRRLRLYVDNSELDENTQGLLDFAISSDADQIVRKAGFIDIGIDKDDEAVDADRLMEAALSANDTFALQLLRDMLLDLNGGERLSTTFRFALGSSNLDNKAERDVKRIVEFLKRPENTGKEVVLIGYTDSDGSFGANVELSRERAAIVEQRLASALGDQLDDGLRLRSTGYGELSPVGCNDATDGRRRNRRVEVWVR